MAVAEDVEVHVGLAGATLTLPLAPNMSMDMVREAVLQVANRPRASVKLSAAGKPLASVDAVLRHHRGGDSIWATFFRSPEDLSLEEVVEELAMEEGEFRGHAFVLSRLPAPLTARHVADYLWKNQLLLRARQAQQLFDQLLPRICTGSRCPYPVRTQLILALHSFCIEPFSIWEPVDGCDECLWANMAWAGAHIFDSGLCTVMRGTLRNLELRSSSRAPLKPDLNNLRGVCEMRRCGMNEPLQRMTLPDYHGYTFKNL